MARLAQGVDFPISRAEVLRALDTLTHVMNKMLELPYFPFVLDAEPVYAKLESLKTEFVEFIKEMEAKGIDPNAEEEESKTPWWYGWVPQIGAGGPLKP